MELSVKQLKHILNSEFDPSLKVIKIPVAEYLPIDLSRSPVNLPTLLAPSFITLRWNPYTEDWMIELKTEQ